MKDNGMKVTENGTISAIEAATLKKQIESLTKDVPALKGEIKFEKDGSIAFTPKAMELLEIKTTEPKKDAADVARDNAGKVADEAGKAFDKGRDFLKGLGKKLGSGEMRECTADEISNGNTQGCKQPGQGTQR
jgi:hypothetical protein